jgi:hypothetical protein
MTTNSRLTDRQEFEQVSEQVPQEKEVEAAPFGRTWAEVCRYARGDRGDLTGAGAETLGQPPEPAAAPPAYTAAGSS